MRLENEKFGDLNHTGVRIPTELKAKIKAAAKQNQQSMNAEIIKRLDASFSYNNIEITDEELLVVLAERFKNINLREMKLGKRITPAK